MIPKTSQNTKQQPPQITTTQTIVFHLCCHLCILQENARLMKELADLKMMNAKVTPTSDKGRKHGSLTPSVPKKPLPSSKSVPCPDHSSEEDEPDEEDWHPTDSWNTPGDGGGDGKRTGPNEELSEGAKDNRLRRLCEKKPSGRCHVTEDVYRRWAMGGAERQKLRDEYESCGWDKDGFLETHFYTSVYRSKA